MCCPFTSELFKEATHQSPTTGHHARSEDLCGPMADIPQTEVLGRVRQEPSEHTTESRVRCAYQPSASDSSATPPTTARGRHHTCSTIAAMPNAQRKTSPIAPTNTRQLTPLQATKHRPLPSRSLPHSPLPRGTGKHQRPHKYDDALLSRAAASNIKRAIEPRTAVHVRKRRTPNEAPASTAMTHQHAPTTRLHHRNLRLETYRAPCRPPYMSRRELCPHGCG